MEETISLKEIFAVVKKRMLMIISLIVSFAAIAFLVSSLLITPKYEATATAYVSADNSNIDISALNNAIQSSMNLINTYMAMMQEPVILDDVAEEMNLSLSSSQIAEKIAVSSPADTQIINVTVTDTDQADAAELANTIITVSAERIPEIMEINNFKAGSLAEAVDDPSPASPNILLNTAIAMVLGAMVGVGLAFLLEYLDNTVKTETDIEKKIGLPVIGIVSHMSDEDLVSNKQYTPNVQRRNIGRNTDGQKKKTS